MASASWPRRLRRALDLFFNPVTAEKRRLLSDRWAALPEASRTPGQGLGRQGTGCGATIGVQPRCDFSCTGCYLGAEANRVPALPLDAVFAQLRTLRGWLGPKGNVQITDGEVTLRPERELVEIVSYARSIGLIPMVMTHGDTFRRRPGLLARLVEEGGLTEVSIHVDLTQRGREGYGSAARREADLMPLRDEFAEMIRTVRQQTGRRLRAATTLTVTSDNLPEIADVTRWVIENGDAFSFVSFQPAAKVGRTREAVEGVTVEDLWREIGRATEAMGAPIPGPGPIEYGHRDCTGMALFLIVRRKERAGAQFVQLIRDDDGDLCLLHEYLSLRSIGATFREDTFLEASARAAGILRLEPLWFLTRARRWISARVRQSLGMSVSRLAFAILTRRISVNVVTIASHHFMSADELATPSGAERLASCVFRVPVGGRMVSMCEANALGIREQFYDEIGAENYHRNVAGG